MYLYIKNLPPGIRLLQGRLQVSDFSLWAGHKAWSGDFMCDGSSVSAC